MSIPFFVFCLTLCIVLSVVLFCVVADAPFEAGHTGIDIDRETEDGGGIDQGFAHIRHDRVGQLAHGRNSERGHVERHAREEHQEGAHGLRCCFCSVFHLLKVFFLT